MFVQTGETFYADQYWDKDLFYTDAACTIPMEGDLDPMEDHTVYLKYIA